MNLKNAAKVRQELVAGGKSPEELSQALGESLKLEGDRLNFLIHALDLIGPKLNDLKRAIVYGLNEGEKAPSGLIQKGDQFYLVEYHRSLAKEQPVEQLKIKTDRKDNGKRGKNKQRRRPERQPNDQSPVQEGAQPLNTEASTSSTPGERPARPRRRRPKFIRKPIDKNNPGEIPASLKLAPLPEKTAESTETSN